MAATANQSASLWDSPAQQQQSYFDAAAHKTGVGDSNGGSAAKLDSDNHDWELGTDSSDADDEAHDQHERSLLARVSQLLARMLGGGDRLQCDDAADNNSPEEDGEDDQSQSLSKDDPKQESRSRSSRESFLQTKLAHVLIELAAEQETLQLAAGAGKELLEQLGDARDENQELFSQLHTCQQQLELAQSDKARLEAQQGAMECELAKLREAWTESPGDNSASNRSSSSSGTGSRGGGEDLPWLVKPTATTEAEPETCRSCPQRSTDLKSVLEENNELKRRCIELENEQGKQHLRFVELQQKHEMAQAAKKKLEALFTQSQRDGEYLSAEVKQLTLDHHEAVAARDNLRTTARRLQCENNNLIRKLEDRDAMLTFLQSEKRVTRTTAQVLENRVSSLQLENQTLLLALAESDVRQQNAEQLRRQDCEAQHCGDTTSLQQHTRDLEHLLDEAQRAVAALKLENGLLRRQGRQQRSGTHASHAAGTIRRTKSMTMTCADILAEDEAQLLSQSAQEGAFRQQKKLLPLGLQLDGLEKASGERQSPLSRFEAAAVSPIQTTASADHAAASPSQNTLPTFLQSVATRRRHTYANNSGDKQSVREKERTRRSTVTTPAADAQQSGDEQSAANSPLYLGLSVIACATAAASILSRR